MSSEWEPLPEDFPAVLEPLPPAYPNLAERIVRVTLHGFGIVALILVSLLMLTFIRIGLNLGNVVDRVNAPDPVTTGCPFGEQDCGG